MHKSVRRIQFIKEYIIDFDGQAAAVRAGYKPKHARIVASQLLSIPWIKEEMQEQLEAREKRSLITADRILRELYELSIVDVNNAYNENGSLKDIHDIPKNIRRSISSIETFEEYQGKGNERELIGYIKKIKLWNKNKALEDLARHLKLIDPNTINVDNREYVQIFRPEATKSKDVEATHRATNRSV